VREQPVITIDEERIALQARIAAYLRAVAPMGRQTQRVGPFLATCTPTADNPYLNYAIPDDGASPTALEIAGHVDWYRDRRRKPRLEYVPSVAPAVGPLSWSPSSPSRGASRS
jgi:hypothetical protein